MNIFSASTTGDWREWLAQNWQSEKEIWLVIHHAGSGTPGPRYHEAVEQALCYGWIDSHQRKHDAGSCILRFTPRNPRSTWSRANRDRAVEMTRQRLMTEHGQALIDLAKATGTWQAVPAAHSSAIPPDLQELLNQNEAAQRNFRNFPPSSKRLILEWIAKAKRPETRQRRISQTVSCAALNIRANHPGTRTSDAGRKPGGQSSQPAPARAGNRRRSRIVIRPVDCTPIDRRIGMSTER